MPMGRRKTVLSANKNLFRSTDENWEDIRLSDGLVNSKADDFSLGMHWYFSAVTGETILASSVGSELDYELQLCRAT